MTKIKAKNYANAMSFLNYCINTSARRNLYDFSSKQALCILTSVFILDIERNCLLAAWLLCWLVLPFLCRWCFDCMY